MSTHTQQFATTPHTPAHLVHRVPLRLPNGQDTHAEGLWDAQLRLHNVGEPLRALSTAAHAHQLDVAKVGGQLGVNARVWVWPCRHPNVVQRVTLRASNVGIADCDATTSSKRRGHGGARERVQLARVDKKKSATVLLANERAFGSGQPMRCSSVGRALSRCLCPASPTQVFPETTMTLAARAVQRHACAPIVTGNAEVDQTSTLLSSTKAPAMPYCCAVWKAGSM